MDLLMRRREMMLASASSPIECPYITDGLIFWLDGIEKGNDQSVWTDLIGGKQFALTNAVFKTNSVAFTANGAYGVCNGPLSVDANTETIEIACGTFNLGTACILHQPKIDNKAGACFIVGSDRKNSSYAMDGVTRARWNLSSATGIKRISMNSSYAVNNGATISKGSNDYWGANNTGKTYLANNASLGKQYKASDGIYCIRIYNRILSVAEMQANQAVDASRFNL